MPVGLTRVLLVEDDAANQEIESIMLERLGFAVDVVADGAAAVTASAAGSYSAILMDCHLPGMDGYEATTAIRDRERPDARVPIIGLSAHSDRQRCIEAGMDDHLAKPFALDELAHTMSRAAPPPDATPHASVLDAEIVDQLRSLAQAGNSDLLGKLQASFARDTPIRLQALRAAVAAGDAEGVAFNVHTLKGSAANLGAGDIVATCRLIESLEAAPPGLEIELLLAQLERDAVAAEAELALLAASG